MACYRMRKKQNEGNGTTKEGNGKDEKCEKEEEKKCVVAKLKAMKKTLDLTKH